MTSQCYFHRIHLAKKALPSLHLKVEQKDIIRRQELLASNRDDYLMIAAHCFQFQNKTWSDFSEWRLRRIFPQILRAVYSSIQLFSITGVFVCSFLPGLFFFWVIKILFSGLLLLPPVSTDHLSLFQSLNCAVVMLLQR